ncbi:unnamed protein product, partial [marine sediment metagenome]
VYIVPMEESMAIFKKAEYWWIDYYDENNERRRKKVSRSKKVAQDTFEEIKTQIRQKKIGIVQQSAHRQISIKNFFFKECSAYFDTNLTKSTVRRYTECLNHFFHFLHNLPKIKWLSQLQPQHFEKYKAYRKNTPYPKGLNYSNLSQEELKKILAEAKDNGAKPAKDNTVNFELRTLRNVFNLAVTWHYLSVNPTKGVRFLTLTDVNKPRFLTGEEIQKLLENSTGEIQLISRTFLLTGMRSGELKNLEWDDIDFKNKLILIRI